MVPLGVGEHFKTAGNRVSYVPTKWSVKEYTGEEVTHDKSNEQDVYHRDAISPPEP